MVYAGWLLSWQDGNTILLLNNSKSLNRNHFIKKLQMFPTFLQETNIFNLNVYCKELWHHLMLLIKSFVCRCWAALTANRNMIGGRWPFTAVFSFFHSISFHVWDWRRTKLSLTLRFPSCFSVLAATCLLVSSGKSLFLCLSVTWFILINGHF